MPDKKPIYDDKVKQVLRSLTEGKTREEIADEMGYKSMKSLDMYLRRKNFRWNKYKKIYVPLAENKAENAEIPSFTKVAQIISLFKTEDPDPKRIAKRLGFNSHLEMANYMKSKGYKYSSIDGNYIKNTGKIENKEDKSETDTVAEAFEATNKSNDSEEFEAYLPILKIIKNNKDRLIDLLMPQVENGKIPRYALGGTFFTKSVHMSHKLDYIIKDFSNEKGIKQREIFEVALIEFFKRYGYQREVENMLFEN